MSNELMISKVVKEGDQLVMLFKPEVLEKMNLKEGQIFVWDFREDGTILVTPTDLHSQL